MTEATFIYVVISTSEDGDKDVEGVFSTPKKAENYKARLIKLTGLSDSCHTISVQLDKEY